MRPTVLDDLGLPAAISLEVERLRKEGYRVEYEEGLGNERLPAMAENALFRIVQEALTNIQKHGRTRKMRIELRRRENEVYLEIRDYGRGFDLEATSPGSELGTTLGIARMREWALLLGGQLKIHTKPGRGTSVVAKVPLPAHEGAFGSRSEIPQQHEDEGNEEEGPEGGKVALVAHQGSRRTTGSLRGVAVLVLAAAGRRRRTMALQCRPLPRSSPRS